MSKDTIKLTAHLSTPLAGDAPFLDALLEFEMAQREGKADKIRRDMPCPPFGDVHIPMLIQRIGGVPVPCASAPILAPCKDASEFFAKRLAVEHSDLLHESRRNVVAVGNATYKSYRLPLRIRDVRRVVWFARATRRHVLKLLKSVHAIGKKRSIGYGRIGSWEAVRVDDDWSWYAPSERGPVLMRPLPWCDELPDDLQGYRRDFGAVQPPMWHPDRYMERVVPC